MRVNVLTFSGLSFAAGLILGLCGCATRVETGAADQALHAQDQYVQDQQAQNQQAQDPHAPVLVSDRTPAGPSRKLIVRPEGCYDKFYVPSLVKVDTRGTQVAKDVFIAKKTTLQDDYYSLKPTECPYERPAPDRLIVYNSKPGFDP